MTTKDICASLKERQSYVNGNFSTDTQKYSNLNLNKICIDSSLIQFQSKSISNEKFAILKVIDPTVSHTYGNKNESLNKSFINNLRPSISDSFNNQKSKNQWKKDDISFLNSNATKNNSTLSLHISAYENLNKTNLFGENKSNEIDGTIPQNLIKKWKNAKQCFNNLTSVSKSSLEFPRQQEENFMNPEIMQFKASQRLQNPNQPSDAASASNKKGPKEDIWAFQPIGSPFPDNPVKVLNEQNMYVALWYKHGKPIFGRAWNNGGVVECAIPYSKKELTGAKDLGGQIQVLQYKGDHNNLGFWYEWIKYKERGEKLDERQFVKCGNAIPIFWKDRPAGSLIGCLDTSTMEASFPHDGIAETVKGEEAISEMYIIVRNINGSPPFCECSICSIKPPKDGPKAMINEWMDIRCGDPFPTRPLVKALGKSLDTVPGQNPDQYVALWYQQGEPIMGRVWNEDGKVAANFGWFKHEYNGDLGSIQILVELSALVRGFDYAWKPFKEIAVFGEKEWFPVFVGYHKGDISPCVLTVENGKQILGKVDVRNERATVAYNSKEHIFEGPVVHPFQVLCRKERDDTQVI